MKRLAATAAVLSLAAGVLAGCEANGLQSARSRAAAVQDVVEPICGINRDSPRGGVRNIMLMEGATDDGIVTSDDGTNHYFDG